MRSEPHADQWGSVALTPRVHRSHCIAGPPLRTGAVMAATRARRNGATPPAVGRRFPLPMLPGEDPTWLTGCAGRPS
jgi:hypothetical protein